MSDELTICKHERCYNPVPSSLNPGAPRKYCSTRCERSQNRRMRYQRERGSEGVMTVNAGVAIVRRTMPRTADAAWRRFIAHGDSCPASGGEMCRAVAFADAYDKMRACLIHAVYSEDWEMLDSAERGAPFERKITAADGRWAWTRQPPACYHNPAATPEEFIAARGAKSQERLRSEFWASLQRQRQRDAAYEASRGQKAWWALSA